MKRMAVRYGIDFSRPQVMTIVNVTPDSFYEGSRTTDEADVVVRVREAVAAGCSIVDVGGYSSRPNADDVSPNEEWRRVETGIRCVRAVSADIPVSIDTFRASVAERAVSADSRIIINDISAGALDPAIIDVAAESGVPYIAMHMRGTPATMQSMTDYDDITAEVKRYFGEKIELFLSRGMRDENIILDAGFGFAKTLDQNYELLGRLNEICGMGYPVLAGLSRKSMIYKLLGVTPSESLAGTVALGWEALRQGATVLRVHDTRAAVDTVKVFKAYCKNLKR